MSEPYWSVEIEKIVDAELKQGQNGGLLADFLFKTLVKVMR
jgi:hypothetical protein